jgi:hypothetical protein
MYANSIKLNTEIAIEANNADQNPILSNKTGNAKNIGNAATNPPNLSLHFAISETSTTTPTINEYFTISHVILCLYAIDS